MAEEEPDFDVAVVGAGPAGATTALLLARAGHQVVLIERGDQPGSKNLSGGVLYGRVLDPILPGWAEQAPVERVVTRNVISFLTQTGAVNIDATDPSLAAPVNAVTVLRAHFDPWLAGRAEEAGAFLMPGVKVDRLLSEPAPDGSPRIVGVRAGDDELRTRVVVAADGVNSFLAQQAGIRTVPATNQRALGVKAVIRLDAKKIEDRFGVRPGHGAAYSLVGQATRGVGGGGFLYTNNDTVSAGVVLRLDDLVAHQTQSSDIFESYLQHPAIAPLIEGGEIIEYGSHLVNEGGLGMLDPLSAAGLVVVGDAAGLTINSGLTIRGMDLAIGSGICAAQVIGEGLKAGDVSAERLAGYRDRLMDSFVGKDMAIYAKAPAFLERPRIYNDYAPLLADILHRVYDLDTTPRTHLAAVVKDAFASSPLRLRDVAGDGLAGVRAL